MKLLELLLALFEVEALPLRNALRPRALETWALRWRELALYARIAKDLALGRRFSQDRYIGAAPFEPATAAPVAAPVQPLDGRTRARRTARSAPSTAGGADEARASGRPSGAVAQRLARAMASDEALLIPPVRKG
jgi:hypothetical protein